MRYNLGVMQNDYECEVRLVDYDFDSLLAKIKNLGGYKKLDYEFDDYYFEPINLSWGNSENLRVREWHKPNDRPIAIYFSKNKIESIDGISFKKSEYLEGKLKLFSGNLDTCFSILNDLGFKLVTKIEKRQGQVWVLPDKSQIILEYVNSFGWSGELELDGSDPNETKQKIENILQMLKINRDNISFKSMIQLFSERNNLHSQ
jgi:predicted adenylyl cyclase CyaB